MQNYVDEENELRVKYETEPTFRAEMMKVQKNYEIYREKAQQNDLLQINENILEQFLTKDNRKIYFYYGFLQPEKALNHLLTLFLMKNFNIHPTSQYTFVYFNNDTNNSDLYFSFKNIFMMLPLKYLEQLKQFIIVKPYFYHKASDYMSLFGGTITKYFKSRETYIESCHDLCSKLKIQQKDFVSFVPDIISKQFPQEMKKMCPLIDYRINLSGQNLTQKQKQQRKLFELSMNALVTKEIFLIENYQEGELGIPLILEILIYYFKERPEGLNNEGIFRKSVSIDEQNKTFKEISQRNYEYIRQIENPHIIANLIKRFFANLKVPVIPYHIFQKLMHDHDVKDKRQNLKHIINQEIPIINHLSLMFLFDFLINDVATKEPTNKMSRNNLAIVFTPCIMRSEKPSLADIAYASKGVLVTNLLIAQYDYIFGDQEKRKSLLNSNIKQKKKEFQQTIQLELEFQFEKEIQEADLGHKNTFSKSHFHKKQQKHEPYDSLSYSQCSTNNQNNYITRQPQGALVNNYKLMSQQNQQYPIDLIMSHTIGQKEETSNQKHPEHQYSSSAVKMNPSIYRATIFSFADEEDETIKIEPDFQNHEEAEVHQDQLMYLKNAKKHE